MVGSTEVNLQNQMTVSKSKLMYQHFSKVRIDSFYEIVNKIVSQR